MTPDLTAELRKQVTAAEADLRARSERTDLPWAVDLRAEYDAAFAAGRTGLSWSEWRDGEIAQGAVAWVLGTVFVRFCEDNDLIAGRWIAGPGEGLRLRGGCGVGVLRRRPPTRHRATGCATRSGTWRTCPPPGASWTGSTPWCGRSPLGDDVCRDLLAFWRTTGEGGHLVRGLHQPDPGHPVPRRPLPGPVRVGEEEVRAAADPGVRRGVHPRPHPDPGAGGVRAARAAADRPDLRVRALPARRVRPAAGRVAGARARPHQPRSTCAGRWTRVHGVDINPFAVAIARFRLVVAALRAAGCTRLADAPAYDLHLAVGDSLLGGVAQGALFDDTGAATFHYRNEDIHEHPGILTAGRYHVVVGNPPYITVKDKALNEAYRAVLLDLPPAVRADVPFMELFFELAIRGTADSAGRVRRADHLQLVHEARVRVEGHRVPAVGHGPAEPGRPARRDRHLRRLHPRPRHPDRDPRRPPPPARSRRPCARCSASAASLASRTTPPRDSSGPQIVDHIDEPGFDGDVRHRHRPRPRRSSRPTPGRLSGGGAGDVKEPMDAVAEPRSESIVGTIGFAAITGEDEAFFAAERRARDRGVDAELRTPVVVGEDGS